MAIAALLTSFACDETGVVSVDWVVLSSGLVGLSIAMTNVTTSGIQNLTNDIHAQLITDRIERSFRDDSQDMAVDADGSDWDVDSENS